jgi:hypothetical protein
VWLSCVTILLVCVRMLLCSDVQSSAILNLCFLLVVLADEHLSEVCASTINLCGGSVFNTLAASGSLSLSQ